MDEKKIHSIIDEAMAARDRSVSIYISPLVHSVNIVLIKE